MPSAVGLAGRFAPFDSRSAACNAVFQGPLARTLRGVELSRIDGGAAVHRLSRATGTLERMDEATAEVEFVFEPQEVGGYYVYAPELPGLHTQGEDLDDATENAREALALYVEGLREDGRSLEMGIVRRRLPLPA